MLYLTALAAQWGAIMPLAAIQRRGLPVAYLLAACGFACSFAADLVAQLTGGSWVAVPWYLIPQLGLFAWAMLSDGGSEVALPIGIYVLIGGTLWFPMMAHKNDPAPYTEFMRWWWPYQMTRLVSFGVFVRAAWRTA